MKELFGMFDFRIILIELNKLLFPFGIFFFIALFIWILMIRFKQYFIVRKCRDFLDMGEHQQKLGTPTMGGFAFYAILPWLFFLKQYFFAAFIAITSGLSGLVGAIDDWYKINSGKGISVISKFILQMFFALISGISFYYLFPGQTAINFFGHLYDIGWLYIFWIMWVVMSTTHAINLIDGIDGLAISQVLIMQIFSPLFFFKIKIYPICLFWCFFLLINRYKALIFMGDIGAFFIGGYLASCFIVHKCELLLIIVAIIPVINTLMIIMQKSYYKLYKKRFFIFTPYHHALEKKRWSENKICILYGFITLCSSILGSFLYCKYF